MPTALPSSPSIHWLGSQALTLEMPPPATLDCQRRIWWLSQQLQGGDGIREIVPGMNNLTVELHADSPLAAALPARLRKLWQQAGQADIPQRRVEIPVCYGGRHGPDLDEVARHCGLSSRQVVDMHCASDYTVFFLGFQPGFAYLGGLASRLATPRRAAPRTKVPAGSVAIGGSQTGIYPAASPGGWQIIGHSDVVLFDPNRQPPCSLQPGDIVRFVAIEEPACWK
ncbi:allophanate hydrolase [Chromobacterium sphagni]|uniref:Allophanate hydrolase n=1 Tax=Chromobacterium sphagni TaxID=1903179 RepID=A0A1S1WVW7_9NEIS|nr:5-oxoprolinase subunit PxpB [Chromobacterium sphagni]OHX11296.1 allophanate hydrolase [Chromobacterium sphagni]